MTSLLPGRGSVAAFALVLAACGAAAPSPEAPAAAPDKPQAQAAPAATTPPVHPLLQRCKDRLADARLQRTNLVRLGKEHSPPRTVEHVLNTYNTLQLHLGNADSESSLMRAVHPDADTRDAASTCEQLVAALNTELSLDHELFEVFASLDVKSEAADVKRLVEKTLEDFKRAGVDKDEATRARIKVLNEELVDAGQKFDKAITSDVRAIEVEPARLKGLPQDWIDAHKPGENGKVKVTTNYPDYIPFMNYAEDDAARRELYVTYRLRAWPQNGDNLKKILTLRWELAHLLGFKDWAEYISANKMIKNEANINDFINKITKASDKRAHREYGMLLAELRRTDKTAKSVGDWQQAYLLNQWKKEKLKFDAQQLRPYLRYDRVKQGLLDLTAKLFHITYRPNPTAVKWHESVEAYDVFEGDKQYGTIYLDMHPRDNKYKHAAQFTLQNGIEGVQLPIGVLVCNFPDPRTSNGQLEHKDVETFFHEFGHLLHHTIGGHQKWARFSGVSTEWDFVEAPSQIFEEWSKDYDTLKAFAVNDKGETVPKDLVQKLNESDELGKGLWVRHQMFYASLSLHLHDRDPKDIDADKVVADQQTSHSLYPFVPGTHMQSSFGHLNGYSAIYYTYMWSMVIAKDMFSAFLKSGILNPDTALRYRHKILEPGGSKDAADLVKDFLGRPYTFKSYEDWLNQR